MVANLILICPNCGKEIEDTAGAWIEGRCASCQVIRVLAPYKTEMTRLWRKYSHYVSKGISVANQDVQIRAKFGRGLKKVLDSIPGIHPEIAARLTTQILVTEAQQAAAGFQRIVRA